MWGPSFFKLGNWYGPDGDGDCAARQRSPRFVRRLAPVFLTGNVLGGLESEVGVGLTPSEFAARASTSISASDARSILGVMGVNIPGAIYGNADVLDALRGLTPMGPEQIQAFLEAAG